MTPRAHQTVDRSKHPTLGEGIAVYDNGPAFFKPDVGEAVPMRTIGFGGSTSDPRRSWLVAVTADGKRVELETGDRPSGECHVHCWSPLFGPGWRVTEAIPAYPGASASAAAKARWDASLGWTRFEPDDGSPPIRWQWDSVHVGRLEGERPRVLKGAKERSPDLVEWDRWRTFGRFEFRDEAPPPSPAEAPPAQLELAMGPR